MENLARYIIRAHLSRVLFCSGGMQALAAMCSHVPDKGKSLRSAGSDTMASIVTSVAVTEKE
jgi:hypothetical protein